MNDKTLGLLEFDAIRTAVASCALSEEASRRIAESLPFTEISAVEELKSLVSFFLFRINSGDEEPRGSIPDISEVLPRLGLEGVSLEQDEVYALGIFVNRGEALKAWLGAGLRSDTNDSITVLSGMLADCPNCEDISREIFRVLDRDGNLRDLPEFREIKRRIRGLNADLERIAAGYSGNDDFRRMLQSPLPSQRDGRMVLALKANFRGRIRGIVHEVSATGQTLFVEPEEVVEKNNDIIIEQRRLDAEIRRVLRELTLRVAERREELALFHERVVYLETLRARARYSRDRHFAKEGPLVLLGARHPLLGSHGVPIDFAGDRRKRTVIITGPNTGGKTVALKTIGLFALMNQFGLALPALEDTSLPVFDGVYADIGDEQSLLQSLSTFSAHMTNIASIASSATSQSLALLDELGSGTDPEEGSAIAMAILDCLHDKGCSVIVTTHHGVLKNYGYTRSGVENASVEFDKETLSPTYRIVMGVPGESRAVDIAARNGLDSTIIETAKRYLENQGSDVSALITELKKKNQDLDALRQEAAAEKRRLGEERRRADLRELRLRQKEQELREGGLGRFRLLVAESRKKLENLVREVREGELSREKTLKVKEFLSELEEDAVREETLLEGEEKLLKKIQADTGDGAPDGAGKGDSVPIRPGIEVTAGPFKRRGTVLRRDKGGWVVEIGSLRMTVDERELIPVPPSGMPQKPFIETAELSDAVRPQAELSLRGMRLEEALETLRKQIDAAVLAGLHEFSVVHGKGEGILQKGVHEFLKGQKEVADYYFSRPELGGFGRTEVILKRS
ncbi:MAG: endonuclease MutS2 [Treponema sp.]|jgi:DNA mismatch repair protein MutS2|nr:endonuclease MutS2 [Treponema sp.]